MVHGNLEEWRLDIAASDLPHGLRSLSRPATICGSNRSLDLARALGEAPIHFEQQPRLA